MGKPIEVSLEAFGNKRLKANFSREELANMGVAGVVSNIIERRWDGEDERTANILRNQVNASGNYTTSLNYLNGQRQTQSQPIKLGETLAPYIRPETVRPQELRLTLTADHIVGYSS
jgi:hypothetical protein